MAKKKNLEMEANYEVDWSPDEAVAAAKLPADITGGIHPLSDYMDIPCDKLLVFQNKQDSDFLPWPEERFQELVDSIREVGVLDAINVRPSLDNPGYYEILEGEHRWKASKAAGRKTIPAHVIRDCDDHMAQTYFSITNILRRENTIRDEINGWWMYTQAIRYKHGDEIEQLIDNGLIGEELRKENLPMRKVYRYAKLHNLLEPFIAMLENKTMSIQVAEPLSYLTQEQQTLVLPYKDKIKNVEMSTKIRNLARGQLDDMRWGKEALAQLFADKPIIQNTAQKEFRAAASKAASIIKKRIAPAYYASAEDLLNEALDLYFKKHPEAKLEK